MVKPVIQTIELGAVSFFARILYIAGLTALIPLLPLLFTPQRLIAAWYAFGIASLFIVLSFGIIVWFTRSREKAFLSLGLMTLVPGTFAVIFSFTGERRMMAFITRFGEITPFIQQWIESYVPKTWLLAGTYMILGVILVWISQSKK